MYIANSKLGQGVPPVVGINLDTLHVSSVVQSGANLFSAPCAIAINSKTGNVYVINKQTPTPFYKAIVKVESETGYATAFGTNAGFFNDPRAIACDSVSGNVFVANYAGPLPILKLDSAGHASSYIKSNVHLFDRPIALALDRQANLFVVNKGGAQALVSVDAQGRASPFAYTGLRNVFHLPLAMALGHLSHKHVQLFVTNTAPATPVVEVRYSLSLDL
jgi:DNA-binding beta-propeller fold protein YncE